MVHVRPFCSLACRKLDLEAVAVSSVATILRVGLLSRVQKGGPWVRIQGTIVSKQFTVWWPEDVVGKAVRLFCGKVYCNPPPGLGKMTHPFTLAAFEKILILG